MNLKREGAQLLQQEGVGNLSRTYEINGVSHIANTSGTPAKTLDIGGLADQGINLLDQWAQKDIAPPATVADLDALSTSANHYKCYSCAESWGKK